MPPIRKHEVVPVQIDPKVDDKLLDALVPTFEENYDRHLRMTGPGQSGRWYWEEMIPWSVGKTFKPGELWDPSMSPIPPEVQSALIVGVLTEDNIPWYTNRLDKRLGKNEAMREWTGYWTGEEQKHGTALHAFLGVTRLVDWRQLEDDRMIQVSGGEVPDPPSAIDGIVYVTFQEIATQIAHRSSGKLTDARIRETLDDEVLDPTTQEPIKMTEEEKDRRLVIAAAAKELMSRIATDETRHFTFYRDAVDAALEIDPSSTVKAIYRQLAEFQMPGTGIPNIRRHSVAIARAGIYNPKVHHLEIAQPLIEKRWKVAELDGLDESGKQAQAALMDLVEYLGSKVSRYSTLIEVSPELEDVA